MDIPDFSDEEKMGETSAPRDGLAREQHDAGALGVFDAESTDPNQGFADLAPECAPTGRFDLGSISYLDEFDELPSAHVSDLDGDVLESGAKTAIMNVPPSMHESRPDGPGNVGDSPESVEMRRWSAGRSGPRRPTLVVDASTPGAVSLAATVSLKVSDVVANGGLPTEEAVQSPDESGPSALRVTDVSARAPGKARELVQEAIRAMHGAQARAFSHPDDVGLHQALGTASAILARLLEQTK